MITFREFKSNLFMRYFTDTTDIQQVQKHYHPLRPAIINCLLKFSNFYMMLKHNVFLGGGGLKL